MMRIAMLVLWPSFLVAIVAEGVFFSLFDPLELAFSLFGQELSPLGAYTGGFFFFWLVCGASSMLTCYLAGVPVAGAADGGKPAAGGG